MHTVSPICGITVVLTLMLMLTLVRFSYNLTRRSSASHIAEYSSFLPQPLMDGMRDRILNPNLSLASANDLVSWVQNSPFAMSPLLSVLRLLGNWTFCKMKSCFRDNVKEVINGMGKIGGACCCTVHGSEILYSIHEDGWTNITCGFVNHCEDDLESGNACIHLQGSKWLSRAHLNGGISFWAVSNVRTDWLSGIAVAMTNNAAFAMVLVAWRRF